MASAFNKCTVSEVQLDTVGTVHLSEDLGGKLGDLSIGHMDWLCLQVVLRAFVSARFYSLSLSEFQALKQW